MEPNLAKAEKIMDYINSHPEEIELYEMRELAKMDVKNAKRRNKQEGLKEGKEIGLEEKSIDVALKSIKENIPIKTISKITGLTIKKIEKLKKEQEKIH